ncbi:MAG: LysE family translocator [Acetobacter indonesiensis]|jgi:threonine/homoserine/homoserine lactone efflux protein|nr:LysE family translocator [Acetobacter indonesiensis]MCI1546123.1 LysE family translocator [Acetobacter indonesiensis]MCI1765569.1 LysE family translocator [Acetobacter indonesiensis]
MTFTQDLSVISSIAALWIVVTIMPGLDFLLVTRLAILQGRMAALRAALGIAVGVGLWGLAGFFGIRALFVAAPWLYLVLKIGGGLYLFVLGVRLFVGSWKKQPENTMPSAPNMETVKGFRMGLLTNLANPKVPVFVTSLFAASLPQQASMGLGLSCVVMMFGMAIGWYALVATLLSLRRFSAMFLRCRQWIDRVAGVAFMGLGIRFATERSA